ncbi:MAG: 50S ribosomal protein L25 [Planctomycetota bacterium]|nr:MAG: 50S ribosomal protein L25 [Planctomycetota bacterium]
MRETLKVELRSSIGKRNNRRLRRAGSIPAILYGHGLDSISLAVPKAAIEGALRHHSRLVDLAGAANESALISDIQWDTFGLEVLHVDFTRVSADERIEVEVSIEIKGQAAGAKEGGIVEQMLREVQIECPAGAIPEKLVLNIASLAVGGSMTCKDLALPEGVTLLTDVDEMIVHCVTPREEEEAAPGVAEGAEPELIGRKEGEEVEEE